MMIRKSPAKVNLALDILKCDPSGYHKIQTVYHELSDLFDEMEFEVTNSPEISLRCDHPDIPLDHTNTALKAAFLLQKHFGVTQGVRITIHKKIPVLSGLGGGSSNAATALQTLNDLWKLHVPREALIKLANQIGMDCAFFLYGGTALGTHFGEQIEPLPALPKTFQLEVIDTGVKISSHEGYSLVHLEQCGKNQQKTKKLIDALGRGDVQRIVKNIHNDFEPFIFQKYPELAQKVQKRQTGGQRKKRDFLTGCGGALVRIREADFSNTPHNTH